MQRTREMLWILTHRHFCWGTRSEASPRTVRAVFPGAEDSPCRVEAGEVMLRTRPVSVQRSRSTLTSRMASLWSARLTAETMFSTTRERSLVGLIRTSSKLRWSTVGAGGAVFLGLLVALLFCTTVHSPTEGGGSSSGSKSLPRGGRGWGAFLAVGGACEATGAGIVGFGMVGSGDGDGGGGGVGWTFAPEEVGACSGGEGCLSGHVRQRRSRCVPAWSREVTKSHSDGP